MSNETRWTPGPWHVVDDHYNRAVLDVLDDDCREVATLYSGPGDGHTRDSSGVWRDDPVRIANANLIAVAPELYEALRDVIGWIPGPVHFHDDSAQKAVERARTVLAKARGEA